MAKFTPGPTIGSISGSIGGTTYSRNRYGAYIRTRAIPITSTTSYALDAKARMTTASQAWQALTDAQRLAWQMWAAANPITDSLGQSQALSGQAAYVGISCRLQNSGDTVLDVPPIAPAPAPLATITLTGDIGIGTSTLAFTDTPLGAGLKLWFQAAVTNSQGIYFVKPLTRLVSISAAALASPYDYEADVNARLGTLTVGQKITVFASVLDSATGLLSAPLTASVAITSTA